MTRYRLLDDTPRIDPEHLADLDLASRALRSVDWTTLPFERDASRWLLAPSDAPDVATSPASGEPPRAGTFNDVVSAILALPGSKRLLSLAQDEALRRIDALKKEVAGASAGTKVAALATLGVVGGVALGSLLAAEPSRAAALSLLKGRDIPLPGVEGLSLRVLGAGAAVTSGVGLPGVSVTVHADLPAGKSADVGVMVRFDLAEFLKGRG